MTSSFRIAPNVKILDTPLRSIADFENWRHSVLYNLRLNADCKPYLSPDLVFGAKTSSSSTRKLSDIKEGKSAIEQCDEIDFMLSTIAQYCPKIPYNDIVNDWASLEDVWQVVRLHSNIETSGALLNDAWKISRLPDETPQALYSRIKQAYDDNLIRKNTIKYKGAVLKKDEEMTPTLHCTIILQWLQTLHPKLRDLVTQRFCTELRNNTYADIWPEISRSIDMLLKECSDDGVICKFGDAPRYDSPRYNNSSSRSRGSFQRYRGKPSTQPMQSSRQCDYCRMFGRRSFNTHVIEDCMFLKRERHQLSQGSSRAMQADDVCV